MIRSHALRAPAKGAVALLVTAALATVALWVAEPASAQVDPAAVRDCVERNLSRYDEPERAAVAQYVDIETACRAALARDDVSVQVTPDGSGGGSDRSDSQADGGAGSASGGSDPSPPAPRAFDAWRPAAASRD